MLFFLYYSLVSFSVVSSSEDKPFHISVVRQTTSLASYETATILCDNILILHMNTKRDNYYYTRNINVTRYDRHWYNLVLGTTF